MFFTSDFTASQAKIEQRLSEPFYPKGDFVVSFTSSSAAANLNEPLNEGKKKSFKKHRRAAVESQPVASFTRLRVLQ